MYLYFMPAGKCAPRSLRTECNLNLSSRLTHRILDSRRKYWMLLM